MRIPKDLDPVDTHVRQTLINTLRLSREARGISIGRTAELIGVKPFAVSNVEKQTAWKSATLARYARAIGWRVDWLLHDLTTPDDDDIMTAILAAGDTSTPEREDRVHWRLTCYDLVRIRRARYHARDMAHRLGVTENAVYYWEANFDGSTIITAQRHARALGGVFGWRLHEVPTPLAAYTPPQRTGV